MIYPVIAYGDPVLKKRAADIQKDHAGFENIVANMFETMYNSHGLGLAAPQVGLSIRIFVLDASPFADEHPELDGVKMTVVNPKIVSEAGAAKGFNEGCLSIPGIREEVSRKPDLVMEYLDENFVAHKKPFTGLLARVIQHEYDHLEGVLFIDHLSPLKKRLLKGRLTDISKGKVDVDYRMKFFKSR